MARAGLSEERVVDEAEHLADEVGLTRLTLAALAERLGVRQPSLYKHIDGMDDLQRSIAVRAKREMADVLGRAAVGRSKNDAIRAISVATAAGPRSIPVAMPAPSGRPHPTTSTTRTRAPPSWASCSTSSPDTTSGATTP